MRPAEVVRRGAAYLAAHGVDSPDADAEGLLLSVLDIDRTAMLMRQEGLSAAEAKRYGRALCRRCVGTPVQHLTGEQGFRRLVLKVRPGVFIPRPETEVPRGRRARAPRRRGRAGGRRRLHGVRRDRPRRSPGAPGARVTPPTCQPEAVALARENAMALGLDLDVREADLLDGVRRTAGSSSPATRRTCPRRCARVSRWRSSRTRARGVRRPGDHRASLGAGVRRLRPGGSVVVEIEESTAATVMALAGSAGLTQVEVRQDLAGRDRVVAARRP